MRELKFRVWVKYKDLNQLIYPHLDDFVYLNGEKVGKLDVYFRYNYGLDFSFTLYDKNTNTFVDWTEGLSEDFVIQQFTGLKDQNGKEIYEGDIISLKELKGVGKFNYKLLVFWDDVYHQWAGKPEDKDRYMTSCFPFYGEHYEIPLNKTEIIGNIFETPEKLDGIYK